MKPNTQSQSFSLGAQFDKNPFESLMGGSMGGGQEQPMAQGSTQGGMNPQMMQDPKRNQLAPGANPGGTKYLVAALQQLQGYIAEATDRDEIQTVRSIVKLLVQMIGSDQEKQISQLGGGQPQGGGY